MAIERSLRRHALVGLGLVLGIFAGLIAWSAFAEIAGAVVAQGRVVVESDVKRVQHLEGGIVGAILARNGDRVEAGQVLIRLDGTQAEASLGIVRSQILSLTARRLRLIAERDGLDRPDPMPTEGAEAADAWTAELRVLMALRASRDGEVARLREQVAQATQNIDGLKAQIIAKDRELSLIAEELTGIRTLHKQNLVPLSRLKALERDQARIAGERGQLLSAVAETKQKIAELELQVLQVDTQHLKDVLSELRDVDAKLAELAERRIAAEDQLHRIDIPSPAAGVVHESVVHTSGGVIGAGETLMLIVPEQDRMTVEAQIAPADIDQVASGLMARVRFPAFDQRTTPETRGTVDTVSPDAITDPQTGRSHYLARIRVERAALPPAIASMLKPGMPAEILVETGSRTILSYFVKPLQDQIARTFTED